LAACTGPAVGKPGNGADEINPTLYIKNELDRRLGDRNPFLRRVLAGEKIVLIGEPPDA
jgi:hypothetical protein